MAEEKKQQIRKKLFLRRSFSAVLLTDPVKSHIRLTNDRITLDDDRLEAFKAG